VVGSNIFNASFCLGASALAGSAGAEVRELAVDLVGLGMLTAVGALLISSERTISRREGAVAAGLYVVLVAISIARG
jgi:Ca2+/Na+ antiporter